MKYSIPEIDDDAKKIAKLLGAKRVCLVPVKVKPKSKAFDCHNNCDGSKRTTGYVLLRSSLGLHAFLHSVEKHGDSLVDISPNYKSSHIVFADCNISVDSNEHFLLCQDLCIINTYNSKMFENKNMYYVYALKDPRTNKPFYVSKGKGDRWKSHFRQRKKKNDNWFKMCIIEDIRKNGMEPTVEFLALSIEDEQLAYDIEALYIKQYGKRSDGGLLVNICDDNRPPNHSGKTYEEICGPAEAKRQKEKRTKLQLAAGGYGPKALSKESREKISQRLKGNKNGLGYKPTDEARKKMKLAHVRRIEEGKTIQVDLFYKGVKVISIPLAKLQQYCADNNLSHHTFQAQIHKNWPESRKGKNKGWLAKRKQEVAVDSYLEGAIKNDVKEGQFAGFEL